MTGLLRRQQDHVSHVLDLPITTSRERVWSDLTLDLRLRDASPSQTIRSEDHILISFALIGVAPIDRKVGGYHFRHGGERGDVSIYPAFRGENYENATIPYGLVAGLPARLVDQAACTLTGRRGAKASIEPIFCAKDPVLRAFGIALEAEWRRPDHPGQNNYIGMLASALAVHLVRTFGGLSTDRLRVRPLSEAVLQKIDNYINDPLTGTVNLNDLAALAGLSRCHFVRAFKVTTTLTPMAYVERSRIERARLLVTDGQMRLAEIAHFIGFADQSHFTRRFKAHVGCTPGDYARLRSADIVRV